MIRNLRSGAEMKCFAEWMGKTGVWVKKWGSLFEKMFVEIDIAVLKKIVSGCCIMSWYIKINWLHGVDVRTS